ncbi:MAG: cell division protein FtsZ [Candidatus ainarchaeum sp.]|nr:cell division protein FtsZ [Candidatus ainarchaeum sp.]
MGEICMEGFISSAIGNSPAVVSAAVVDELMSNEKVKISVVGVGGGGTNTIHRLSRMGIKSAETIAINTDRLHLETIEAKRKLLIGASITKGLGSGGYPEVAQKCAQASKDALREAIRGTQLMFLCAGMGGGTGTGASPVVAEIARDEGCIVVGVVTYPFNLERARTQKAAWGIQELSKVSDTVIVVDNNRLAAFAPNLPINQAFTLADEITARAVKGISDTIMFPSLVNIDFADVRAIVGNAGVSMMSVGEGVGQNRVESVVKSTLEHPLIDVEFEGAKGALLHINGGPGLTLGEATEIGEKLTDAMDVNANVIWGARLDPEMRDAVTVTAILTGVKSPYGTAAPEQEEEKPRAVTLEYL